MKATIYTFYIVRIVLLAPSVPYETFVSDLNSLGKHPLVQTFQIHVLPELQLQHTLLVFQFQLAGPERQTETQSTCWISSSCWKLCWCNGVWLTTQARRQWLTPPWGPTPQTPGRSSHGQAGSTVRSCLERLRWLEEERRPHEWMNEWIMAGGGERRNMSEALDRKLLPSVRQKSCEKQRNFTMSAERLDLTPPASPAMMERRAQRSFL